MAELLKLTGSGLYCEAGDFFVDPWGPVERAVITHAHSDHARWGSKHYLTAQPSGPSTCTASPTAGASIIAA
jgi:putative mRNA 3-end processing factor